MPRHAKNKPLTPRKIFLVEDHPTFREGLAQILNKEEDLTICGTAGTAAKAMQVIDRLKPDLMLVDISLPGKSGLEMIKEIRKVNRKIKLLVLSMHDEALYADRVLRAGGDGYIMKQEDPEEIIQAIRDVLSGHVYVSEEVFARSSNGQPKRSTETKTTPFDHLADLELEILASIGRGRSNGEIAKELRIGAGKVECAVFTDRKEAEIERHKRAGAIRGLLGGNRQDLKLRRHSLATRKHKAAVESGYIYPVGLGGTGTMTVMAVP